MNEETIAQRSAALRGEVDTAAPIDADDPGAEPPLGATIIEEVIEPICDEKLTLRPLSDYLFAIEAGKEPDRPILDHLARGCEACSKRVDALKATEPFLIGRFSAPLHLFSSRPAVERSEPGEQARNGRVQVIQELTDALVRLILEPNPTWDETTLADVEKLECAYFEHPPGPLREQTQAECDVFVRRLPRSLNRKAEDRWAEINDKLTKPDGSDPIQLGPMDLREMLAIRLLGLSKCWMMREVSQKPWIITRNDEKFNVEIDIKKLPRDNSAD